MSANVLFELPEAREKWEGFKEHPSVVPTNVEFITKKEKGKNSYIRYKTDENSGWHVAMPSEITALVADLRAKHYAAAIKDLDAKATDEQKEEALWDAVKGLTVVRKEGVNMLPQKGDKVVWVDNAIGRTDDGLFL